MTAPVSQQAAALNVLADKLRAHHLVKCGVTQRRSEADHLIEMLKHASDTLRADRSSHVTLTQLRAAADREKANFDRVVSEAFPGMDEWHWIRAVTHMDGDNCHRRNDDTSQDAAMAAHAGIKAAWSVYMTALHSFYALRDGPNGVLGPRVSLQESGAQHE